MGRMVAVLVLFCGSWAPGPCLAQDPLLPPLSVVAVLISAPLLPSSPCSMLWAAVSSGRDTPDGADEFSLIATYCACFMHKPVCVWLLCGGVCPCLAIAV